MRRISEKLLCAKTHCSIMGVTLSLTLLLNSTFATGPGNGSVYGTLDESTGYTEEMALADAVSLYNDWEKRTTDPENVRPLRSDELIAGIVQYLKNRTKTRFYRQLLQVLATNRLPVGSIIHCAMDDTSIHVGRHKAKVVIYEIVLEIGLENGITQTRDWERISIKKGIQSCIWVEEKERQIIEKASGRKGN